VEGVAAFSRDESDGEPVAFAAAGRLVVILAVADEGRRPHAGRHERRELRHGLADGLVQGRHRGAAIVGQGGEEFGDGGEGFGHAARLCARCSAIKHEYPELNQRPPAWPDFSPLDPKSQSLTPFDWTAG
jgi:hypothetical protein